VLEDGRRVDLQPQLNDNIDTKSPFFSTNSLFITMVILKKNIANPKYAIKESFHPNPILPTLQGAQYVALMIGKCC
jgi:hypothetical protein